MAGLHGGTVAQKVHEGLSGQPDRPSHSARVQRWRIANPLFNGVCAIRYFSDSHT